jgi:LmbE family N-acetylglucosaminyl deacetylase
VHAPGWPRPLGLELDLPLAPPATADALAWQSLALSEPQRLTKLTAVRAHRSQMQLLSPFMKAFVRANEIFAPAP